MSDERSGWHAPGSGPAPEPPRYGAYAPDGTPQAAPQLPPQGSWTPPPKPGLVPLRPLGFGTLLGAPFRLLRSSRAILGLAIGLQLVLLLLGGGIAAFALFAGIGRVTDFEDPDQQPLIAGGVAGIILSAVVVLLLNLIIAALLQGFVVVAAARAVLGEKMTLRQLWATVKGRLLPLIGWTALVFLATAIAFAIVIGIAVSGAAVSPEGLIVSIPIAIVLGLGLIVLSIWVSVKLSLLPSILVLERGRLWASLARSWRLTNGHFWRTLGVQLLISVIVSVAAQVIATPVSLIPLLGIVIDPNGTGTATIVLTIVSLVLSSVLSVVIAAVTSVVLSGAISLIYLDLRMRKEGLDLVLQRHVEEDTLDDPFAPGVV